MKTAFEGYSFKLNEDVTRAEAYFKSRYGIELAGDLYVPKDVKDRLATIVVCGLFGAVKEQVSGLYVDEMASRGFAALALDPSLIGGNGEEARNVVSPDINMEDFSAAVDVLSDMDMIDPEGIDVIGICDFSGMALNAAAMNTHIKAMVTSTMYGMTCANTKGYFDQDDSAQTRYEAKKILNTQRTEDFKPGTFARAGGIADLLPDGVPFPAKDYCGYYKTEHECTERFLNSNEGWNETSLLSFTSVPILQYSEEIRDTVLMIHGERAYSCYLSRSAFPRPTSGNKELLVLPDTIHTDLYDRKNRIPFHKIENFFTENLCRGRSQ